MHTMVSDEVVLLLVAAASGLFGYILGVFTAMKRGITEGDTDGVRGVRPRAITSAKESEGDTDVLLRADDLELVPVFMMPGGSKLPHRRSNCGGSRNAKKLAASRELFVFLPFPKCCKAA